MNVSIQSASDSLTVAEYDSPSLRGWRLESKILQDSLTIAEYNLPLRHELHTVLEAPAKKIPPQNQYQKQLLDGLTQHIAFEILTGNWEI